MKPEHDRGEGMYPPVDAEQRFQDLYRRLYPDILGYAARRIGDQDAVDAAADVFLVAWRRINEVPEGDAARPWLFGVARNVLLNRQRARQRFRRFWEHYRRRRDDPPEEPEAVTVRRGEYETVLASLGRLRPDEQELLRLVAWEELPYAEIAVVLGCSRHAVDQRVQRARRHLARAVERSGQVRGRERSVEEEQAR